MCFIVQQYALMPQRWQSCSPSLRLQQTPTLERALFRVSLSPLILGQRSAGPELGSSIPTTSKIGRKSIRARIHSTRPALMQAPFTMSSRGMCETHVNECVTDLPLSLFFLFCLSSSDPQPKIAFSSEVENANCKTSVSQSFSEQVTSSTSDTWQLSSTVSVSNSASVTVGVPDIGGENFFICYALLPAS